MTLDELAQQMATEFGEQYGDLDIADQFQKWVQETYEEVVADARWFFKNSSEEITPVAGTAVYTLPTTVSEIRAAYINSTPKPARVSYSAVERLLARGENLAAPGTPRAWYYAGIDPNTTAKKIKFWPVPDAAFAATGNKVILETINRPETLALTDTIPLPTEYIRVIRDGVRYRVKFNDNDLDGSRASYTVFREGLARLNARFHGAEEGGSNLRVKRLKATRQAPGSTEEG